MSEVEEKQGMRIRGRAIRSLISPGSNVPVFLRGPRLPVLRSAAVVIKTVPLVALMVGVVVVPVRAVSVVFFLIVVFLFIIIVIELFFLVQSETLGPRLLWFPHRSVAVPLFFLIFTPTFCGKLNFDEGRQRTFSHS